MKQRIEQLQSQVISLESIIASAKLEKEVEKAAVLASKLGLDENEDAVKEAIKAADFAKIASIVAESEGASDKAQTD